MKRSDLHHKLTALAKQLIDGCGNHGCVIKAPTGMATNGPCNCRPRTVGRYMFHISSALQELSTWEPEEKGEG